MQTPVTHSDMEHTVLPANNTISAFTPSHSASPPFDRYSLRLLTEGWPGWVDLGGWLDWDNFPHQELNPDTVTHPSTNRARRRVTSLIWPTSLPTEPNRICHEYWMHWNSLESNLWAWSQTDKSWSSYHDSHITLFELMLIGVFHYVDFKDWNLWNLVWNWRSIFHVVDFSDWNWQAIFHSAVAFLIAHWHLSIFLYWNRHWLFQWRPLKYQCSFRVNLKLDFSLWSRHCGTSL